VGLSPGVVEDVLDSTAKWTVEGDASIGWRVELSLQAPGKTFSQRFYLLEQNGRPRILTAGIPYVASGHVLDLDERGAMAGAKTWLDWATIEFSGARGTDPLSGSGFMALWKKGDPAEADHLRRGAAALGVGTDAVERCLGVLEPAKAAVAERERAGLYGLLLTAYEEAERWEPLAATSREALEIWPESGIAFESLSTALIGLGRMDDLDAATEERLSQRPDDWAALRAASRVSVLRGPHEDWDAAYRRFIESKNASLNDYNNYAWAALTFGRVSDDDLENAKHAASDKTPDGAALNTLAALYAEVGRYPEAKEALVAGMEADHAERPAPADWYVMGRIAEGLGEIDEARRDYDRAIEKGDDSITSVSRLASRRLASLSSPTKPAAGKRGSR